MPRGTPVFATADGIVIKADWQNGYGQTVVIDHGNGLTTRYGHLSKIEVTQGQEIRRGEELGQVGSTGRSTGAHLHYETRNTAVYVTHDQVEAMTMADRIVILNDGRIEQIGSPLELYETPRNQFVAGFIGSPQMNFLPLTVESQNPAQLRCRSSAFGAITLPFQVDRPLEGKAVTLGVRPEHVHLGAAPGTVPLPGVVNIIENLGSETFVHVEIGENTMIVAKSKPGAVPDRNHRAQVGLEVEHLYLFGEDQNSIPVTPAPVSAATSKSSKG